MRKGRTIVKGAALLLAVALLAGCKTTSGQRGAPIHTGSITPSVKEMQQLRERWRRNPQDIDAGLAYARQLKALGQKQQYAKVMARLAALAPDNLELQRLHAVALLEVNRPAPAESIFRSLLPRARGDWRILNGLGSALAAQGRYEEARTYYRQALKISPDNARVINNLAMSHILQGNPQAAERLLRTALQQRRNASDAVSVKLRQNLALAVGLQGRFDEARNIASFDLPAAQAAANMAYLKRMLGAGFAAGGKG